MSRPEARAGEAVVLAFPESVTPATEYRTTWVVSSLEGLRALGHFDRYLGVLQAHHDEILNCVAGGWLPISVVRAHYEACEALGLSAEDRASIARAGGNVRRAWHASVVAATQREDADIWEILKQLHKIWQRGANGGACAVYKLGDKRARVEYIACELFDIPYFRGVSAAVLQLLTEHLHDGVRVTTLTGASRGSASYILEWA